MNCSPDGHDGFLLEFEQINKHVLAFLHDRLPSIYEGEPLTAWGEETNGDFKVTKTSVFGEAEADVSRWQVFCLCDRYELTLMPYYAGDRSEQST